MHLPCLIVIAVLSALSEADQASSTEERNQALNDSSPAVALDDGPKLENCLKNVHENAWQRVVVYDAWAAVVLVLVNNTGPRVLTCLEDQKQELNGGNRRTAKDEPLRGIYEVSLVRRLRGDWIAAGEPVYFTPLALTMGNNEIRFKYVIFHGSYRVQFRLCDMLPNDEANNVVESEDFPDMKCPKTHDGVVESKTLKVSKSFPLKSWCDPANSSRIDENAADASAAVVEGNGSLSFAFEYDPCTDDLFPYESASVTLYSSYENDSVNSCSSVAEEILARKLRALRSNLTRVAKGSRWIAERHVEVKAKIAGGVAMILFKAPKLEGNKYYCATAESNHILCDLYHLRLHRHRSDNHPVGGRRKRLNKRMRRAGDGEVAHGLLPDFCVMFSDSMYLPDELPLIADYLPYCTSHLKCGWLYILVVGSACFLSSCLLALCFVQCCCGRRKSHHKIVREDDQRTFDTMCMQEDVDSVPAKMWSQVHDQFYAEPPKNPGKILLLYSPDSKQFKELQKSFRNFLEMACHCVVLDLFDEQLFQTICYDPEQWIGNLLKDRHFKMLIVCSEGAFKRQQALLKGEVLNIPKIDSSLDGLFTAGLKFIQEHHAYDHNRLALVRYESLAWTKPEHKLTMMSSTRGVLEPNGEPLRVTTSEVDELIVPSQLPELFCWIHDCAGGNFSGRPWDKYHLELQLLLDDLKQARQERKSLVR